ncbi:MAG: MMPL family transporter [Desulfobacteraceae bacterium]
MLKRPVITLVILICVFSFFGFYIKDFRLDASSDSLVLEHDRDLKYFKKISQRYGTEDFLFLAYQPKNNPLFSQDVLARIKALRNELRDMDHVESVLSILDVPLLKNPPVPIKNLVSNIKTLEHPDADLELARAEFKNSPLYQELLVSRDLSTTALQINFKKNEQFQEISRARSLLRDRQHEDSLSDEETQQLENLEKRYRAAKIRFDRERHADIAFIRSAIEKYKTHADIFLGGTSMIADDMITFVKNDIKVFGTGMFIFLVITLKVIFKKKRWVFLPMVCCCCSIAVMAGLLGMLGWEVTVISSNFISLQLIITMALTIHLIVRYRELAALYPDMEQFELVKQTIASKFIPCFFTTLTTIAGFSSLLMCDILPVITFGWMMCLGLVVSLVVIFLLFPTLLILLPRDKKGSSRQFGKIITDTMAVVTEKYPAYIYSTAGIILIVTVIGISKLSVENSFIDYFKQSTEIYRGMKVIDQKLGGTTPLDVMINFDASSAVQAEGSGSADTSAGAKGGAEPDESEGVPESAGSKGFEGSDAEGSDGFDAFEGSDGFDDFEAFDEFDEEESAERYWFTSDKMALIKDIHNTLESHDATGKVLSLGTMMKIAEDFTDGRPLDNFELAVLYSELPDEFKDIVLKPYVSIAENQARIAIRIKDSLEDLKRDEFLERIHSEILTKFNLNASQVKLSGLMVLYNNMLQSLFSSQILTMGYVVLAVFIMFMIIFKSLKIGLIAVFPNILASIVVLAAMGLSGHPLDMMTITIAAISIGIAVDDTIHYIHRFREELQKDQDRTAAMHRSHNSIGNAMFYTSLTIIVGFSILVFSNFIPTVMFGFLTGLAMLIALITAMTLLPRLLIDF